jgi:antitoxin ParD1/3/4
MNVVLRPEQQQWLEELVEAGTYASVEEAVASILAQHMELEIDDLEWAKPLLDEAREQIARGEVLTLEEHRARMDERFGKLRR